MSDILRLTWPLANTAELSLLRPQTSQRTTWRLLHYCIFMSELQNSRIIPSWYLTFEVDKFHPFLYPASGLQWRWPAACRTCTRCGSSQSPQFSHVINTCHLLLHFYQSTFQMEIIINIMSIFNIIFVKIRFFWRRLKYILTINQRIK